MDKEPPVCIVDTEYGLQHCNCYVLLSLSIWRSSNVYNTNPKSNFRLGTIFLHCKHRVGFQRYKHYSLFYLELSKFSYKNRHIFPQIALNFLPKISKIFPRKSSNFPTKINYFRTKIVKFSCKDRHYSCKNRQVLLQKLVKLSCKKCQIFLQISLNCYTKTVKFFYEDRQLFSQKLTTLLTKIVDPFYKNRHNF